MKCIRRLQLKSKQNPAHSEKILGYIPQLMKPENSTVMTITANYPILSMVGLTITRTK